MNFRPHGPEPCALAKLSYAPNSYTILEKKPLLSTALSGVVRFLGSLEDGRIRPRDGRLAKVTSFESMVESWRKSVLYFRRLGTYWQLVDANTPTKVSASPLGYWPLSVAPRLEQGHFVEFDERGLPLRNVPWFGGVVHQICTVAAFALAHWELYLLHGSETHLRRLLDVADYFVECVERPTADTAFLRAELHGKGHVGRVSAMDTGEAISVLCRAWQTTQRPIYLETAMGCLAAFEIPVEKDGVVDHIRSNGSVWYEEKPGTRWTHILNGMIYALWGLRDLHTVTGSPRAKALLDAGLTSVEKCLPLFDCGYWSLYHLPKSGPNYVASMMYHELHICQLTELARSTGNRTFALYAEKFRQYSQRSMCRAHAAIAITGSKLRQWIGG